ncbi:T9SS type A sorting domain-containing protein [Hymenobacter elongatus]|uniref:T9SS type A sorting domain-containing protein n=1 Tax=Hymenobacter elongatus TaxID=877208 RepID=A0A4Z0PR87_9BACT|nr:T9SS type A sorting domain-containing protein [Hymenobacter elongatus]TGE17827.1 T9SS type A sorting domain-containing protein [Hymenobacter elongatus]
MKKLLLPALLACAVATATPVASVSAQTVCPAAPATVAVSGAITSNTTWTSDNIYLLNGFVFVENGAVLTIQPGTIIKGDKASKGALIIRQGGRIEANGTAAQPIVFTSNQPAGSRARGDWGGLILCGRAPVNQAGTPTIEGGVGAIYGGTDPNDNSGTLRYVRIEFPGIAFQPNSEINGLTMGGVGAGTTIDYVQVAYCGDDSFEWFGGTVNAKHLIAIAATDDDFDTDFGFQGKVQYGLVLREPNSADVSGSTAFESDNDAAGSALTPRTAPIFSNITAILPNPIGVTANFTRSMHLRRNTSISIFNSVLTGWPQGLTLDGSAVQANATGGTLVLKNNVMAGMGNPYTQQSGGTFDVQGFWLNSGNTTLPASSDLGLNADNFRVTGTCSNAPCVPDLALPAGSVLNTGASFADAKLADTFFEKTGTFRGAFGGTTNWAAGWSNFNPQTTCYNRPGVTLAAKPASEQVQGLSVAPNPTAGAALLSFTLQRADVATVRVADALGRQVAVIEAGRLSAGPQQLALPSSLKNGVYIATVTTNEVSQTVRFVVAK